MSDATKVLDQALALDRRDRTTVVLKLLQSLDGASDGNVEAAWQAEIERRIEEVKDGTSESSSLEEMFDDLDQIVDG